MILVRQFEEACAEQYSLGLIHGFLHLAIGQEAAVVGAMDALRPEDAFVGHYREHGHALARGVPARALMAELFGDVEGCCRGRGGSMHIFDRARRFYGGHAIVGGGIPTAVGLALADAMRGNGAITACAFGDGAAAEGAFHESLNLAVLWRVPVLFLCENNRYAMGTRIERELSTTDISARASSYGLVAESVDGMDVLEVAEVVRRAADAVRTEQCPRFVELRTYRFRAHSMFDPERYRDHEEVERWRRRDPIGLLTDQVKTMCAIDDAGIARIESEVAAEVADSVAFATAGTREPGEALGRFVLASGTG